MTREQVFLTVRLIFSPPSAKRRGGVGGGGSIGRDRCFGERRATPHPRPHPTTRDARGGRGVALTLTLPGPSARELTKRVAVANFVIEERAA
jgi:hypothetical protein